MIAAHCNVGGHGKLIVILQAITGGGCGVVSQRPVRSKISRPRYQTPLHETLSENSTSKYTALKTYNRYELATYTR